MCSKIKHVTFAHVPKESDETVYPLPIDNLYSISLFRHGSGGKKNIATRHKLKQYT
jgi:hypothetical protein